MGGLGNQLFQFATMVGVEDITKARIALTQEPALDGTSDIKEHYSSLASELFKGRRAAITRYCFTGFSRERGLQVAELRITYRGYFGGSR